LIEIKVEARFETVFGEPIADHDGNFGKWMQDDRYIRFELFRHLAAAEDVHQVFK
jgi:hypothetical protein